MTALKHRNRLLALRLTDDEYSRLKSACAAAGGHSLSEFTRSELLSLLQPNAGCVADRLSILEGRVADLENSIQNLDGSMRSHDDNDLES